MVPHQHHTESEDNHELIEEATSPLDFLILMFHEDLGGDNHLEDYNVSANIHLSTPFVCVAPTLFQFECALLEANQSYPPIFKESTLDSSLRPSSQKRGPPANV